MLHISYHIWYDIKNLAFGQCFNWLCVLLFWEHRHVFLCCNYSEILLKPIFVTQVQGLEKIKQRCMRTQKGKVCLCLYCFSIKALCVHSSVFVFNSHLKPELYVSPSYKHIQAIKAYMNLGQKPIRRQWWVPSLYICVLLITDDMSQTMINMGWYTLVSKEYKSSNTAYIVLPIKL